MLQINSLSNIHELDWLAPSTRQVLQAAQQEALDLGYSQVDPEHLLLGLLMQEKSKIALLFSKRGVDGALLRRWLQPDSSDDERSSLVTDSPGLPFSVEAVECVRRAITFVQLYPQAGLPRHIEPEILALSVFYHPRIYKFFYLYSRSLIDVKNNLLKNLDIAVIRRLERHFLFYDHMAAEERAVLSFVNLEQGRHLRVLKFMEPPNPRLQKLLNMDLASRGLQELLSFLRDPEKIPHSNRTILLIEQNGNNLRKLMRVLASQAGVPLAVLFCSVLSEGWAERGGELQDARSFLQEQFLALKMLSAGVVFLEDIDVLVSMGEQIEEDERERFWSELMIELDRLQMCPGIMLVASTSQTESLPEVLFQQGRFEYQVMIDKLIRREQLQAFQEDSSQLLAMRAQPVLCYACQRPIHAGWRYCTYCGASFIRSCHACGAKSPDVPGAKFCASCGQAFESSS
ncbi:AAA family ATPase [Ktedonosporobacter rubrisoli]|uniref:AAA family ATPase n=1 Tax=Ktedonosporobacter rubrisoli TaxID=2509675 RepID=A0A4V0YY19_KTERU|nr:Clp protease N-terminal domain-containing protein [Ktedonosporobacter rubrisoli]QBD74681.1 AAA family ATPase [Ktedonosporobacter rubrisoli]